MNISTRVAQPDSNCISDELWSMHHLTNSHSKKYPVTSPIDDVEKTPNKRKRVTGRGVAEERAFSTQKSSLKNNGFTCFENLDFINCSFKCNCAMVIPIQSSNFMPPQGAWFQPCIFAATFHISFALFVRW